ncbi:PepSY domain-containing protein [Cytobacillus praedii]|uniref:PepSY domain-containing protein n=1 Tax=Cytobacillus praedii TaxID=1742358 RepID=UPI002E1A9F3B|nr:PepSY domain-containing protein [Cytobacillus praedii]MED3575139.1 PepSY domain-containing protein [Cytobacillus praedii]
MMKNKLLISGIAAALLVGGTVAVSAAKKEPVVNEGKMITAQEAEKIALTKAEGRVESVELENRFGQRYFDVDIENGNMDYDIHIDAYSGDVLKVKEQMDMDDDWDDDNFDEKINTSNKNLLSSEKAIEIAEKTVNGKVTEMDKDEDDGRMIYEFELKTNKGKVDLELDAITGDVLNVEYDD